MAARCKVDEPLRQHVVSLKKRGMTISAISRETNRSKSVIWRILKFHEDTGLFVSPKKPGRPRKTTPRQDWVMHRLSISDRFNTASGIAREVNSDSGMDVSRMTVSRRLHEVGLDAHSPATKPPISKKNQKSRLAFANKHVIWNDDEWLRVFFSDESKFNLVGSDGRR